MEMLELKVQENNRALAAELSFVRGRVLGLVAGNHSWKFINGTTSDDDLAGRLDSECIGWLCHYTIKVTFGTTASPKQININIVLCHGQAGGRTVGASVNQMDYIRRIFPAADIYVAGHDHQRYAKPDSVLIPSTDGKTKQKRQFLCRAGSFKKAYVPGASGYEIGRLLKPSDLGGLMMTIAFHRDKVDGDRIITDIEARI